MCPPRVSNVSPRSDVGAAATLSCCVETVVTARNAAMRRKLVQMRTHNIQSGSSMIPTAFRIFLSDSRNLFSKSIGIINCLFSGLHSSGVMILISH